MLWSFPLGRGYGGASVHRGEVFVLDRIANQSDILRCIDLDGKVMWAESPEFELGAYVLANGLILNQDGKSGDILR